MQPAAVEQRKGLLSRLAGLGLAPREEDAPHEGYAPATAASSRSTASPGPAAAPSYQTGQLDQHGRLPAARSLDDEHLEIPAFLRRQNRN